MSRYLMIAFPLLDTTPWPWGVLEDDKLVHSGNAVTVQEKSALAEQAPDNTIVVIPGQHVRIFTHDLPPTRRSDALKAAAFSVEEKLAGPVANQHVALGQNDDKRVAIIAKTQLESILKSLAHAGLSPTMVIADFDGFAAADTAINAFERLIITGPSGMALDADWEGELPPGTVVETLDDAPALQRMATHIMAATPINLLQGDFSKPGKGWNTLKGLRRAAVLLVVLGAASLLWNFAQARALISAANAYKAQTARLYTQALGAPPPANPALAVTRQVQESAGMAAGFLELSQILFDGIAQVEGLSVETLDYDASQTVIRLRLSYPSFESASDLEAAIAEAGGHLAPGGLRETGGVFIGDAVLGLERVQ